MDLKLKDRIAFVTGASRGIGLAIAEALAAEGVHLALFGRDEAACCVVARGLLEKHAGLRVEAFLLDFERPETIGIAVGAAAANLGGVDILVNCAGGSKRGWLNDLNDEDWEPAFRVKPIGLMRMTRETLPFLKQSSQPRVINISGNRGREPRSSVMGGAINLGTHSLTKALANEFGKFGITVNAVAPGFTKTRRWIEFLEVASRESGVSVQEVERQLIAEIPMGRVLLPEDIADTVVFLASARAGMITGTAIYVDGGNSRSI
jgi:NAD(P)-dependent dehydrogenase (short-subunit alcohol dehydrogenase family)